MNNREIAFSIWISLIIIIFLFQKDVRKSMIGVIKAFFAWKLSVIYILMILYMSTIVLFLYEIQLWNNTLIKDTILWIGFVGFLMLASSNKVSKDPNYFRKIILDNLKIVVIIEFITNAYVFNIYVELILVPIIIFFSILSAYTTVYDQYKQIKVVIDYVLISLGLIIFIYAFFKIISSYKDFASLDNFRSFLIAPILTFLFLPFMYFLSLFMTYEILFVRINVMFRHDDYLNKNIKISIVKNCLINLYKLNRFSRDMRIHEIEKKDDIENEIQRLKQKK